MSSSSDAAMALELQESEWEELRREARKLEGDMVEPPNLMPSRSARLPLDTKHPKENTNLLGSIGHSPGENPKIHIFAIKITNERIKLTSFITISYITFNTTSEYNIYYYNCGM